MRRLSLVLVLSALVGCSGEDGSKGLGGDSPATEQDGNGARGEDGDLAGDGGDEPTGDGADQRADEGDFGENWTVVVQLDDEAPVTGDGELREESRTLSGFTAVENASPLAVHVELGEAFRVKVRLDANLVDQVRTELVGETLRVSMEEISFRTKVREPHVRVTLPRLLELTLSSAGVLRASASSTEPLRAQLLGSGVLDVNVTTPALEVLCEGSGSAHFEGSSEHAELELESSGLLDASALVAAQGLVANRGSGALRAHFTDSVAVTLGGSGLIDLSGGATVTERDVTGSGLVREE